MNEQFNVYGVEERYGVPPGGDWLDAKWYFDMDPFGDAGYFKMHPASVEGTFLVPLPAGEMEAPKPKKGDYVRRKLTGEIGEVGRVGVGERPYMVMFDRGNLSFWAIELEIIEPPQDKQEAAAWQAGWRDMERQIYAQADAEDAEEDTSESLIPDLDFRLRIADEVAEMQGQIETLQLQCDAAFAERDSYRQQLAEAELREMELRGEIDRLRTAIHSAWQISGRHIAEEIATSQMPAVMAREIVRLQGEVESIRAEAKDATTALQELLPLVKKVAAYKLPKTTTTRNPTLTALFWFNDWAEEAKDLLMTHVETEEAA